MNIGVLSQKGVSGRQPSPSILPPPSPGQANGCFWLTLIRRAALSHGPPQS